MEDMSSQKESRRHTIRHTLSQLHALTIAQESQEAQTHVRGLVKLLLTTGGASRPLEVAAYMATPSELDLSGLWLGGETEAEFYFPLTRQTDGENDMDFAPWPDSMADSMADSLPAGWTRSTFGIAEPPPDAAVGKNDFDIVLMPCLSVDRYGARLGHGAGYYDRWLARTGRAGGALLIACCLREQLSQEPLPQDLFDVPVDAVLTADGIAWRLTR